MFTRPKLTMTLSFWLVFAAVLLTKAQIIPSPPDLPRYKFVTKIESQILDSNGESIIYARPDGVMATFTFASKTTTLVYTNATGPAFFTPTGFLLTHGEFLQIEDNQQLSLGTPSWVPLDFNDRIVDGRFAMLKTTNGLLLRDLVAQTNCLISTDLGYADVAPNGAVVFTSSIDETNIAVCWFQSGETKTLAVLPNFPVPYVATDGTN